MTIRLSRRLFVAGAAALTARPAFGSSDDEVALQNPLVRQRADAQVFRHDDGHYYMTASVPEYDRLIIRRSKTLGGLGAAEEAVIWRRPTTGKLAGYIWAPELHFMDGRWFMYFAAGDGDDPFHIRTYVLRCLGRDPLASRWEVGGQFQAPWDSFNLDPTIFTHRSKRYICWAQKEPGIDTNSNLYLAPLATPTTLARAPLRLTVPTLPWEVQGFKVNEAPALLARNGRLFLTYSASATDARYCLGMLTAADDADIMNARSWTKSLEPVFASSVATQVYGPGHNSFTTNEAGEDILVYHGRDYAAIKGDPLFDPNRHTRVQRLYYQSDGTPDFGIPIGNGPLPARFSPVGSPGAFLCRNGSEVRVGRGALVATQFRLLPSRLKGKATCIVPIEARDSCIVARPDGRVVVAKDDGSPELARRSAFMLMPVQDHDGQFMFASAVRPGAFLVVENARLRLAWSSRGDPSTGTRFHIE